jgi:hypothetical protein
LSLAVHTDGTVSSWGTNLYGTLGAGTIAQQHTPFEVPLP